MRYLGHNWSKDGESWLTVVDGRFHVLTWPFGPHHQSKVVVAYEHARGRHTCCEGNSVGVGLDGGPTQEDAMACGLSWVDEYRHHGPQTPEQVIARCFAEYPTLYHTRADVVVELWLGDAGDGYEWLDGAIFNHDQGSPPDFSHLERLEDELHRINREIHDTLREVQPEMEPYQPPAKLPDERPLPDDGEPRDWKLPVGGIKASRIWNIPPDLRPEWLESLREATRLLRDRSVDSELAEIGRQLALDWGA